MCVCCCVCGVPGVWSFLCLCALNVAEFVRISLPPCVALYVAMSIKLYTLIMAFLRRASMSAQHISVHSHRRGKKRKKNINSHFVTASGCIFNSIHAVCRSCLCTNLRLLFLFRPFRWREKIGYHHRPPNPNWALSNHTRCTVLT